MKSLIMNTAVIALALLMPVGVTLAFYTGNAEWLSLTVVSLILFMA